MKLLCYLCPEKYWIRKWLVINYKPLNKDLKWIRCPIPNRKIYYQDCIKTQFFFFSKFDMEYGFWQIPIDEDYKYKTAFTTPFGHFRWNFVPFGLKNALSEFQNIINDIFTHIYRILNCLHWWCILVFLESVNQQWNHLNSFVQIIKNNGLVVSPTKIKLFQDKMRFLGHNIYQGTITPIDRSIQFADKFLDEIKNTSQLQSFLGSLNYVSDCYKNLGKICRPFFKG